jgi:superfamily II DNA/RNA helicase
VCVSACACACVCVCACACVCVCVCVRAHVCFVFKAYDRAVALFKTRPVFLTHSCSQGLDIGDVDLIVCFDTQTSSIRLIQRMGRTGLCPAHC